MSHDQPDPAGRFRFPEVHEDSGAHHKIELSSREYTVELAQIGMMKDDPRAQRSQVRPALPNRATVDVVSFELDGGGTDFAFDVTQQVAERAPDLENRPDVAGEVELDPTRDSGKLLEEESAAGMEPVRAETEPHLIGLRIREVMTPEKPVKPVGVPLCKVPEELQDPPVTALEPSLATDDPGQALSHGERQDAPHAFAESTRESSHGLSDAWPRGMILTQTVASQHQSPGRLCRY
jgi:hypothetical protein